MLWITILWITQVDYENLIYISMLWTFPLYKYVNRWISLACAELKYSSKTKLYIFIFLLKLKYFVITKVLVLSW